MTDPRTILAAAGVSVPEVERYRAYVDDDYTDSVNDHEYADAALLALAREVAKWKWVAEHEVSFGAWGSRPARVVQRFIEYPEDLGVLLARYAEESNREDQ